VNLTDLRDDTPRGLWSHVDTAASTDEASNSSCGGLAVEHEKFEFVGSLTDLTSTEDDEDSCPSGRKAIPVCCSAGLA
jgi:hypothetical protein